MGQGMTTETMYRVRFSGKFIESVNADEAIAAFAALAKIPPQQAATALSGPRVLKKQLDSKTAHAYQAKLKSIGLDVALEPETPEAPAAPAPPPVPAKPTLSLQPIEDRHADKKSDDPAQRHALPDGGVIACPKCGHEQNHTGKCDNCGVYIHKVLSRQETETTTPATAPKFSEKKSVVAAEETSASEERSRDDEPQDPKPIAILATLVVAAVCAYAWKMIAVLTEYEVGIVAWAIGGAIGFTAIALGSIGVRTGIICGVFALCSIIGGKYLTLDTFIEQAADEMKAALIESSSDEFTQESVEIARRFTNEVHTDEQIRTFMWEQQYIEVESVEDISDEDVQTFKEEVAPFLRNFAERPMTEESMASMSGEEFFRDYTGASMWQMLLSSLGLIDVLFLFLGVGTAFRMGMSGRIK